jgi:hypothetical protein
MFNKKHSEETKLRMRLAKLGKLRSEETCERMRGKRPSMEGPNNPRYGINGSNHPMFGKFGELSANWKGGITPLIISIRESKKYDTWRSQIYERDLFTCQSCMGENKNNLEAHHIKRLTEIIRSNKITNIHDAMVCDELWDMNNGTTLCHHCHSETNNYGNRRNKNEL